jgi:hypothetical protein
MLNFLLATLIKKQAALSYSAPFATVYRAGLRAHQVVETEPRMRHLHVGKNIHYMSGSLLQKI